MPELPEVQTITTDLNKIKGFKIKEINVLGFDVHPNKKDFVSNLLEREIISAERIAKNIVLTLDNNTYLNFHLAMTGQLLFKNPNDKNETSERVIFGLEKDKKTLELRYKDTRKFGKVRLLSETELEDLKQKYGPDALDADLNSQKFMEILKTKNTNIKNALLDQKLVAGIGNIYATDALFLAGIHPKSKTKDLDIKNAEKLLKNGQKILKESIEHRGSTLPDKSYVDAFGRYGKHQNFFKIYGKKTCEKCGNKVKFEKINGRGTYYCENCQKLLGKSEK